MHNKHNIQQFKPNLTKTSWAEFKLHLKLFGSGFVIKPSLIKLKLDQNKMNLNFNADLIRQVKSLSISLDLEYFL